MVFKHNKKLQFKDRTRKCDLYSKKIIIIPRRTIDDPYVRLAENDYKISMGNIFLN